MQPSAHLSTQQIACNTKLHSISFGQTHYNYHFHCLQTGPRQPLRYGVQRHLWCSQWVDRPKIRGYYYRIISSKFGNRGLCLQPHSPFVGAWRSHHCSSDELPKLIQTCLASCRDHGLTATVYQPMSCIIWTCPTLYIMYK